ncbi:hypothetical protein D3C84_914050 [compost metagenome]
MGLQQVLVDRIDIALDAVAAVRAANLQLVADGFQQLGDAVFGIEDDRNFGVLRQLLEQAAAHRGLAGADIAGQQDETAVAVDAVEQAGQSLAVLLAQVQVARVGRYGERQLGEAEIIAVHGHLTSQSTSDYRRPTCSCQSSRMITPFVGTGAK